MKRHILVYALVLSLTIIFNCTAKSKKYREVTKKMKIESLAFTNEGVIPSKYTCDGDNINPELKFIDVPENAKSLVLIMDDPDAPMGTWQHWLIWNISPDTKLIEENSEPKNAVFGMNDFRRLEYGGPCPPSGVHRYFFRLYALDKILNLNSGSSREQLERAIKGHIIAEAVLMGKYSRK